MRHGGSVKAKRGSLAVDRTVLTTQSVEYDALVVAGGASAALVGADPYAAVNLGEAFRHHKPLAAIPLVLLLRPAKKPAPGEREMAMAD